MNTWIKAKRWVQMAFSSLFWGMKGADVTLTTSNENESEIKQQMNIDNVFQDFVKGEETERVQEYRDAAYRILREADKYEVELQGIENENGELTAKLKKKVCLEKPRIPIYDADEYKVMLVQANKDYANDSETQGQEAATGEAIDSIDTLIFTTVYEEGLRPRFEIVRYIKKLVVKTDKYGQEYVDLYFSEYPRQFAKQDSLFIAEMNKVFNSNGTYFGDFGNLKRIGFVTDKAFGVEDFHGIYIDLLTFSKIEVYDGNFVVEYTCNVKDDDVVEKYKRASLDKKYKEKAPKKDATDINAITKKMSEETLDYNKAVIKIK